MTISRRSTRAVVLVIVLLCWSLLCHPPVVASNSVFTSLNVFVDFFANWCSHCRDLAPTWETLAEVMYEVAEGRVENHIEKNPHLEHEYTDEDYTAAVAVELPVLIGKVDCVDHHELCMQRGIRAYPTLKFFWDGKDIGDYRGHRTVVELAHFIEAMEREHRGKEDSDEAVKSTEAKDGKISFTLLVLIWC